MRNLDVWYAHIEVERLFELSEPRSAQATRQAARRRTRGESWRRRGPGTACRRSHKLADEVDGELRIVADPPLIVPIEDLVGARDRVRGSRDVRCVTLIRSYRRTLAADQHHPLEEFHYVHAARKVVGVGSVGTRAWILLLLGRDDHDPLFLQAKEAQASVLERFLGKSQYHNHGQRVVAGQRLMQAASDIFLGWQRVNGYRRGDARLLRAPAPRLEGRRRRRHDARAGATVYARMCGATLARAHARWGDRIAIAAYLGKGDVFDRAIADFSAAYADQNERDYQALIDAVAAGRITAETGR